MCPPERYGCACAAVDPGPRAGFATDWESLFMAALYAALAGVTRWPRFRQTSEDFTQMVTTCEQGVAAVAAVGLGVVSVLQVALSPYRPQAFGTGHAGYIGLCGGLAVLNVAAQLAAVWANLPDLVRWILPWKTRTVAVVTEALMLTMWWLPDAEQHHWWMLGGGLAVMGVVALETGGPLCCLSKPKSAGSTCCFGLTLALGVVARGVLYARAPCEG